jgi:hypothetical protein
MFAPTFEFTGDPVGNPQARLWKHTINIILDYIFRPYFPKIS